MTVNDTTPDEQPYSSHLRQRVVRSSVISLLSLSIVAVDPVLAQDGVVRDRDIVYPEVREVALVGGNDTLYLDHYVRKSIENLT